MTTESKTVLKLAKVQDAKLSGKNIVMRVDYNVPIKEGVIKDDTRIRETLKTLKLLLEGNNRVVLMAHMGRPKGQPVEKYSLKPVAAKLAELSGAKVHFAPDCVGPEADKVVDAAQKGELVLLENLRFHAEEEKNDDGFARQLARHGEFFVQEAFGALHRAHSSTAAIAKFLPGAIGFLVQKELEYLDKAMVSPVRPFLAIIGGAKVSDKLPVLYSLLEKVDTLIIGGGMAYTFLAAQNVNIGKSLLEADKVEEAKNIILKAHRNNVELLLPADHRVVAEISETAKVEVTQAMAVPENMIGVDVGPRTELLFADKVKSSKTIFWNGPVGIFETPAFASGSVTLANAMAAATKAGATTILGGGDTLNVLKTAKLKTESVSHASTGGGASLEFIEGKQLPGLVALSQK